jgi:hypothetical protein
MNRDTLLHELNQINGELRCASKHVAYGRMHNCRVINPAAPSEGNAEINAALIESHQDRQESNQLVAKKNELLLELAQTTGAQP